MDIEEVSKDKIMEHVTDTLLHKSYVIVSCLKMSRYLVSIKEKDLAFALLQRANIHDNSKLVGPELELLSSIYGNKDAFIDPNTSLSDYEKLIIEKHWENNRHHPEHFKNVENMTELDIIEMVCDWYARSLQFGTDFLSFVKTRQETRFHFPDEMFMKILNYCEILSRKQEDYGEVLDIIKKENDIFVSTVEGEMETEYLDNSNSLTEYDDFLKIDSEI